jgi:ribosomal protein S18 acetylase RimI-like enzyme
MMLVQQISQPPAAPPPQTSYSTEVHPTVNDAAPLSVLQLGKAQWAASTPTPPELDGAPAPSSTSPIKSNTSTTGTTTEPSPQAPPFTLRPGTSADASQIRSIGSEVFSLTFGFSIPPADLSRYLSTSYAIGAIQSELASPSHSFICAVSPTDPTCVLGFAQLTEHTSEACLDEHLPPNSYVELQRLYVRPESHGKGVGKALIAAMEAVAREKGYGYVWLGVWEGNFVAQTVYEGAGYARLSEHEFVMGRCVQIDWIMVKEL